MAACLEVLATTRRLTGDEVWAHVRRTTPNPLVRATKYPRKLLADLGLGNDLRWFLRRWVRRGEPEDMFWGLHAARFHPTFRVAPVEETLHFAVEAGLEEAWPVLTGRPPFGCHRNWILEMLGRYLHSTEEAKSARERLVWALAAAAGMKRPSLP